MTGSSAYYMKNMFSESLADCKKKFKIYPISLNELLSLNDITTLLITFENAGVFVKFLCERLKNYYESYINYGGITEVVLSSSLEVKKDRIHKIISSYIIFKLYLKTACKYMGITADKYIKH